MKRPVKILLRTLLMVFILLNIYANITTLKKLVIYNTAGTESLCTKENNKWVTEVQNFLKN
jgi:hypothetical protein